MAFAGPAEAQTITAPGLVGQPACVGPGETDNPVSGSVSAITANSATLTLDAYNNLYSVLTGRIGDGSTPTEFIIKDRVQNLRTGITYEGNFATISSTNPNLSSSPNPAVLLSDKTPHVYEIYVDEISDILLRRCFMTGGTYTITNLSILNGSNGCFSISPLTPLDARNCLCGRGATGSVTIDSSAVAYDYTSIQANLGCDGAG